MNAVQNDELSEMDCYTKIIEIFERESLNREEIQIWKSRSLIKLMGKLETTQNKRMIKNALILLISLFGNIPPDIYNNRGIDINRLSEEDKIRILSELEEEFLSN